MQVTACNSFSIATSTEGMLIGYRTSSCTLHTRPRVQQAPAIPCSLSLEGKEFQQTSGASRVARTRTHIQSSSPALCAIVHRGG